MRIPGAVPPPRSYPHPTLYRHKDSGEQGWSTRPYCDNQTLTFTHTHRERENPTQKKKSRCCCCGKHRQTDSAHSLTGRQTVSLSLSFFPSSLKRVVECDSGGALQPSRHTVVPASCCPFVGCVSLLLQPSLPSFAVGAHPELLGWVRHSFPAD